MSAPRRQKKWQEDDDDLPFIQVHRSAPPRFAAMAQVLGLTSQHVGGGMVAFWSALADPRALERLLDKGQHRVVLSREHVELRLRMALGVAVSAEVAEVAGFLEAMPHDGWRVRGMSRYFQALGSRRKRREAGAKGGRAKASGRANNERPKCSASLRNPSIATQDVRGTASRPETPPPKPDRRVDPPCPPSPGGVDEGFFGDSTEGAERTTPSQEPTPLRSTRRGDSAGPSGGLVEGTPKGTSARNVESSAASPKIRTAPAPANVGDSAATSARVVAEAQRRPLAGPPARVERVAGAGVAMAAPDAPARQPGPLAAVVDVGGLRVKRTASAMEARAAKATTRAPSEWEEAWWGMCWDRRWRLAELDQRGPSPQRLHVLGEYDDEDMAPGEVNRLLSGLASRLGEDAHQLEALWEVYLYSRWARAQRVPFPLRAFCAEGVWRQCQERLFGPEDPRTTGESWGSAGPRRDA